MRGTFDFRSEQYPFLVQNIGFDLAIRNQITGEILLREPVAGEYQSEERKAQAERFDKIAIEHKGKALYDLSSLPKGVHESEEVKV